MSKRRSRISCSPTIPFTNLYYSLHYFYLFYLHNIYIAHCSKIYILCSNALHNELVSYHTLDIEIIKIIVITTSYNSNFK